MAAIVVEDLRITYADLVAVDGLSFDAAPGEIVALLGPNGAGKTSTVEAIEGFRRPASGTIRVLGLDPIADHAALVPRIGVMLQDGGVATGIRPIEVLELYAAFFSDAEDPDELLTRVGLADRRRSTWRQLSGGEQQRLSLALALVGKPEVAFLDEPTAGVDPQGRQLIRQVITELRDAGVCVLVTTHDLDEAERLADRVLIIDRGRLVASGTPAELMAQTGTDEIRFGAREASMWRRWGRRSAPRFGRRLRASTWRRRHRRRTPWRRSRRGWPPTTWPSATCAPAASGSRTCSWR
ncbi:MAG: ABC transporter ATP-binding protein [Acidimicrobiales bacterium]